MPTVYEDSAHYGLTLLSELHELHIYEGAPCHNWRIAVWQDQYGHVWYAVEDKWGKDFDTAPFADVDGLGKLCLLSDATSFSRFKDDLNCFWRGRRGTDLTSYECWARNKRGRLQRKVGRIVFS